MVCSIWLEKSDDSKFKKQVNKIARVKWDKFKFIKTIQGCDLFQYYLKDEVVILYLGKILIY